MRAVPRPLYPAQVEAVSRPTDTADDDVPASTSQTFLQRYILPVYRNLARDSGYDLPFLGLLLLAEVCVGTWIIRRVAYTEIDWKAYMQQVATAWNGERDYRAIRGDTGPLVYPAGFLYFFGMLYSGTREGREIPLAQVYFLGFYLLTQCLVWGLCQEQVSSIRRDSSVSWDTRIHKIWIWRIAMGLICLSKRLHSIFLLRLFNDGPTMMLLYGAVRLFQQHRWRLGCLLFSIAVSLKMNVLLFAPGLLLLLLQALPDLPSVLTMLLLYCGGPQLILAAPFLLAHPVSYLRKAFEFDRVFQYQWTVNWKCLSERVFASRSVSRGLLLLHVTGLLVAAVAWVRSARRQTHQAIHITQHTLSPHYITYTLLASNFIGIVFARTLHYQFYSWYFHAVIYLLCTALTRSDEPPSLWMRAGPCLLVVAALEACFLTFPATPISSVVLHVCHALVLATLRPPRLWDEETQPVDGAKVKIY